jgi:hypothetical protein
MLSGKGVFNLLVVATRIEIEDADCCTDSDRIELPASYTFAFEIHVVSLSSAGRIRNNSSAFRLFTEYFLFSQPLVPSVG